MMLFPMSDSNPDEPTDASGWHARALALASEQRMSEATQSFARAAALAPADLAIAAGYAQACYVSGLPAAELFLRARHLAPANPDITLHTAVAFAAEGRPSEAEAMLVDALHAHPEWLDGHRCLASMRWAAGRASEFVSSYREACRVQPRNPALRMAWFSMLALIRDWPAAAEVLDEAAALVGDERLLAPGRLFIACETGATAEAERLLPLTDTVRERGVEVCRIRHFLRTGQIAKADAVASRVCQTPAARLAWPYRSLIWRLQNDPRAHWLDGDPAYVRTFDLDFSSHELDELAVLLRGLHTANAPYIEQSVRGGTQTDRPLLFRHEPVLQLARQKFHDAVQQYIAGLPAFEPGHPLLGVARQPVRFSGSWSVRLNAQGFHISHTHPKGWISSAFYVALPDAAQMGEPPAGWIRFGAPPPELGLALNAYQQIEPKRGRLVLFPSTTWHATAPFSDGERLVIAFDVGIPRMSGTPTDQSRLL
jgi:tetratricopeptide (TPR) repeat protein